MIDYSNCIHRLHVCHISVYWLWILLLWQWHWSILRPFSVLRDWTVFTPSLSVFVKIKVGGSTAACLITSHLGFCGQHYYLLGVFLQDTFALVRSSPPTFFALRPRWGLVHACYSFPARVVRWWSGSSANQPACGGLARCLSSALLLPPPHFLSLPRQNHHFDVRLAKGCFGVLHIFLKISFNKIC